jgi:RimJ/RimL family protein N-acetyltransferase
MEFRFTPIAKADACAIVGWRYGAPYAAYDCPADEADATVRHMLDPANRYFAVRDGTGALVGYCCFGPDARVPGGDYVDESVVDVGLGLRPDLAGRGLGLSFVQAIVAFAQERLGSPHLRLTVAAFNQRAIRVHERAGFRTTHTFTRASASPGEPTEWIQMTRRGA